MLACDYVCVEERDKAQWTDGQLVREGSRGVCVSVCVCVCDDGAIKIIIQPHPVNANSGWQSLPALISTA